jgi:hypothetical protein
LNCCDPHELARFRDWFANFAAELFDAAIAAMLKPASSTMGQRGTRRPSGRQISRALKHMASPRFWAVYQTLPASLQRLADAKFNLLRNNPRHPSLQFKKAGRYWSARVGQHYRALAVEIDGDYLRFWIGSHADYDRHLR